MAKTTKTYWNPLHPKNAEQWEVIEGTNGLIEQLFLAIDEETGDYTRLTRFKAGADTTDFGAQIHDYPEEIFIVSGQIYDKAFDRCLEAGDYASRPPGEVHGPFVAETDCLVLDCSYPSQNTVTEKPYK
ncbi:hypothetical protein Lepto7376_0292 [[Leptolyngbya] sp. PCC 7376]|uniref:cupin domain-containing protein n=1 Tax=[Leptolyngbya] sp. PCC 7376 TaxID=111781 RepID=UPI00029F1F1C|nr:cupin domain-containing protein [[Leptolyngbya] sp. PCC 7376]AFY36734.1 hypothetical protein Lepto7376_0292 [[Leptolyngbya] sp. PCC 7376]